MHKVLIVAPSLDLATNVSGVSAVTNFIIAHNRECEYEHFLQGRSDGESGALKRVLRIWKNYRKWKDSLRFTVYSLQNGNDNGNGDGLQFTVDSLQNGKVIIHYNYPLDTPSIVRDYFFMSAARRKGIPMVIHIHGGLYLFKERKPFFIKWILDRVFSWNNPFIVLSEKEREEIQRQYGTKNVTVLPNCVEVPDDSLQFTVYSLQKDNGIHVLYLGRIEPNKGMDYLLEAMRTLKEEGRHFVLHLAGIEQGKNRYIERYQELLGDRFVYEGIVSGEKKATLLKRCQVFVLPSLYEGLPISLLETMSYGLVPVVTDVGSIGEYVKDGENGLLIGLRDAGAIAEMVRRLDDDRALMMRMSEAARQTVRSRLNPQKYIENLNMIYRIISDVKGMSMIPWQVS